MKLERWALVMEIVSGIAVVVTLILLIIEVRQNTVAVQASAFQSVSNSWTDFTAMIASDSELNRIYRTGRDAPESLAEGEDTERFGMLMLTVARRIENAFMLQQSGLLSDAQTSGFRVVCQGILGTGGGAAWFKRVRRNFSPAFGEFVDRGCEF